MTILAVPPIPAGFPLMALLLGLAAWIGTRLKIMDAVGAFSGWLIGAAVFLGGRWIALLLLSVFVGAGSIATRWKMRKKLAAGLAEAKGGTRSAVNALANGGVAAALGLAAWWMPHQQPLIACMIAGSLASATSDTLSSELGNLYGSRYYYILTFRRGHRGRDGVVSPEGTLAGLLGSALIAALFALGSGTGVQSFFYVTIAGMTGNVADSFLGATLQRSGWLNNHSVNFISTALAAATAGMLVAASSG